MKKFIARLIGTYLNVLAWIAPHVAARKGFELFCTPIPAPMKGYHRRFLDTAEKSQFEFEGIVIQAYRWGRGEKKILFLHGWQSHTFRWKKYIESFPPDAYTLYALDAPAHGLSGGKYINLPLYSRVISHFIEQIAPLQAVISHSFGSFSLLYAAYKSDSFPVERLVIMGTPGEANEFIAFYRSVLGLSPHAMNTITAYFTAKLHHPPEFFSAARFAGTLSLPGLIVHDEHDAETPYRHAVEIHDAWKNSKLVTTSGLGHNLKSNDVLHSVMDFVTAREKVSNLQ